MRASDKKIISDELLKETKIISVQTENNEYKLDLWIRDSSAGVGTVTFYIPDTNTFACLEHGIADIDTKELITISNRELVIADIVSIEKGEKGKPLRNKKKYKSKC